MAKVHKPRPSVVTLIENVNAKKKQLRHGWRVPASSIGKECLRASFYSFRWVSPLDEIDGRLARLFITGDLQEERFTDELREAGLIVVDRDHDNLDDDGNPRQIGVSFADGHGYGYLDGEVAGVPEAPKKVHVLEYKTHSEKSFKQLENVGVEEAKPEHYVQMQIYMHVRKRDRALYLAVNKNDDSLFADRIPYDWKAAQIAIDNASRIVFRPDPPPRISDKPDFFVCRFCDHHAVCHEDATPLRNCRTCIFFEPIAGGSFLCQKFNVSLKRARQEKGCGRHLYVPTLINGEQIGANLEQGFIEYAMRNGETWRNLRPGTADDPRND